MIFSDRSIDIYGRITLLRILSGPENRPDRRFFLSKTVTVTAQRAENSNTGVIFIKLRRTSVGNENNQDGQQKAQAQDLNQILKNKREKLAKLQEEGKDPFRIMKYDQTHP